MARSDSFFIRARVATNGTTFAQTSIDLGAYVDALGKSVLRIHNMAVQWGDPDHMPSGTNGTTQMTSCQITTQSQGAMVNATDKSVIASGKLVVSTDGGGVIVYADDAVDVAPQDWTNGYLVGVEQIYLGTDSFGSAVVDAVNIILECTVESLTGNSAMALALSQQ